MLSLANLANLAKLPRDLTRLAAAWLKPSLTAVSAGLLSNSHFSLAGISA